MIGTVIERECTCNSNNHCCVHVYNYLLLSFRHKQRKENKIQESIPQPVTDREENEDENQKRTDKRSPTLGISSYQSSLSTVGGMWRQPEVTRSPWKVFPFSTIYTWKSELYKWNSDLPFGLPLRSHRPVPSPWSHETRAQQRFVDIQA
jgi:hypothetical protein